MIAPSNDKDDLRSEPSGEPTITCKLAPQQQSATDIRFRSPTQQARRGIGEKLTQLVGRHPLISIAVASTIGVTAGWLVKRRR